MNPKTYIQLAAEWVAEHAGNDPLAHALAVALAAFEGWDEDAAMDFENFMTEEVQRQEEFAAEEDTTNG